MAASQQQKVDYLLKKVGYSISKTGIAEDSALTGSTKKAPYAETIPSPLTIRGELIWSQSDNIPTTPPTVSTQYVKAYAPGVTSSFQMTVDSTVSNKRTFVARSTVGVDTSPNVGDWIDAQFSTDYTVGVFSGNPASGGVKLSADGSGSNDTWFFDYSSGVLNFNGDSVPVGVTTNNVFITGWRYIGAKGVLSSGGQAQTDLSVASLNVTGVTTLGITSASQLRVSGITTLGITSASQLSVTGISTFGNSTTGIKIDGNAGIITSNTGVAVTFVGNLSGTASTASFASTAISVIGGIASVTDLSVSGISTFGTGNVRIKIDGTAGIITSVNPGVAITFVGNLSGTASTAGFAFTAFKLDATNALGIAVGFATTARDVIGGIGSLTDLRVTGITTVSVGSTGIVINGISGIITSSNPGLSTVTYWGDGSKLSGIKGVTVEFQAQSATTLFPTLASNSGVSSIGIATTGSTAFSYIPSSGNIGIGTTTPSSKLSVNGNVLISGITTVGVGSTGIVINGNTGVITSINPGVGTVFYFGDGSNLTGIKGVTVELQAQVAQPVFPTLATNSGVSSVGIATTGSTALSFNPSTGSLGIGTTTPSSKLTVNGDALISGISTFGNASIGIKIDGTTGIITSNTGVAVTFVGNLTGTASTASFATTSTNVIGSGIASVTDLRVTGVSTFGSGDAKIVINSISGIITSSNAGIAITFIGNLTGTASTASFATTSTNVIGGIGSIKQLLVSGVTTSSEFVGGGSDLRNLQGTHLVSYSSHSESSNSSTSIIGISTYRQVGILTGTFAIDGNDSFGSSVATSADGKTIVIGASLEPGKSDGLPGQPNTGLVYVFDRNGNSFTQVGILSGSNAVDTNEFFGFSVATSADGKSIIVGAYADETLVSNSGIVYVFDRVGNSFNQVGILTGSTVGSADEFGKSVATSADGKTIIVGSPADELPGLDGTGLVYVFDRNGDTFNQVGILTGSNAIEANDLFGFSVATSVDGKTIIVGAKNGGFPTQSNTGLVYVFDRNGNSFNQVGILTGSNSTSADEFGSSVATSADGKTIVVGVSKDEFGSNADSGIAYVYDRNGNSFNQVGILTGLYASNTNDNFGNSVAISADGKTIVVGSLNDEPPGPSANSGIVYVFKRIGNTFNRVGIVTGSFAIDLLDQFGASVAVSADGKSIIVGAINDETLSGPEEYGLSYVFDEVKETYLYSNPQGNIGIGTSNPTSKLSVNGTVTATSFVGDGSGLTGISFPGGNFTQSGTGAVTRTISSKFNETVSVKDFGAVGDGTTNDTAAIQAAINSTTGVVYFPEGQYLVKGSGFTIAKPIKIQGEGPASVIVYEGAGTLFAFTYSSGGNGYDNAGAPYAVDSITIVKQSSAEGNAADCCIELRYTGAAAIIGEFNKLYLTNISINARPTAGNEATTYWKKGLYLYRSSGVYATNITIGNNNGEIELIADTIGVHIYNDLTGHFCIRTFTATNVYIQRFQKGLFAERPNNVAGNIESIYLASGEILADEGFVATRADAISLVAIHFDVRRYAFFLNLTSVVRVANCDIRSQAGRSTLAAIALIHCYDCNWHTWTGNIIFANCQSEGVFKVRGNYYTITGNYLEGSGGVSKAAIIESGSTNVFMSNNVTNNLSGTPPITDNTGDAATMVWAPNWRRSADGRINVNSNKLQLTFNGYLKVSNTASFYNDVSAVNEHQFLSNQNNTVLRAYNTNASFSDIALSVCVDRSNSDAYSYLVGWSSHSNLGAEDREFNLRGDGSGFCDGSWTGGGADYAEYFEWLDGNPTNEDRRGFCVVLVGNKIRQAVTGEEPIGVISGNPSMVGDSAWNKWNGKYLTDDYGSYIREDYEVTDEDGVVTTQKRRILNPNYDPNTTYVPRESRPEWDCVGLLGKLRIRNEQVINPKWILMQEISDSVKEYLVR